MNTLKSLRNRLNELYHNHRRLLLYALPLIGLILIGMGLFVWLRPVREKEYQLTIASGSPVETRNAILRYFTRKAPKLGVFLKIEPCDGTLKALEMIDKGDLDLALVQGIVRMPKISNVRQVTTFYSEPAHLLVRSELEEKVKNDFNELAGRRIHVSEERTATNLLSDFVLDFIGLRPAAEGKSDGYSPVHMSNIEILRAIDKLRQSDLTTRLKLHAKLPDAFIVVNTLPSKLASALVTYADYRLIPLKFGKAAAMISMEEVEHDSDHIDRLHLEIVKIPAFTYSVSPPVPAESLETLGIPMILVAHKKVPDEVVSRMLSLIYSGPVHNIYHPPQIENVSPLYPLHPGSIQYRDRNKPLLRSDVVDSIGRTMRIVGLFIGGLFALYGYYRWRRVMHFRAYFGRLLHLQGVAKGKNDDAGLSLHGENRFHYVQRELDKLQRRALVDFCNNYFVGEGVLGNLLVSIAEARRRLSSLETEMDDGTNDPNETEAESKGTTD